MSGKKVAKVTLIPIAMVTPTEESIYAPSRIRPSVEVDEGKYTRVQDILVSFAPDGKSDAAPVPTYVAGEMDKGNNLILASFGRYIKR